MPEVPHPRKPTNRPRFPAHRIAMLATAAGCGGLIVACLGSCANRPSTSPIVTDLPAASGANRAADPLAAKATGSDPAGAESDLVARAPRGPDVVSVEPWRFSGQSGLLVQTPHYRIFATETDPLIIDRIPSFMESALRHYRIALTPSGPSNTPTAAPLPEPALKLDTYIMRTRTQWQELTRQFLGANADPFLAIQRGGYAWGGKAMLFDIGERDTFTIAAHEGWHQYTQRAFTQALPVWLEEGIATYMEGHTWNGLGRAEFKPWANAERFDELRRAAGAGRLMSLETLLEASPSGLLGPERGTAAATYYAQAWALTHYLASGDRGDSLARLLRESAAGTLDRSVSAAMEALQDPAGKAAGGRPIANQSVPGGPAPLPRQRGQSSLALRRGPAVFMAYFGADLERSSAEYHAFVQRLVRPGTGAAIGTGRVPFTEAEFRAGLTK